MGTSVGVGVAVGTGVGVGVAVGFGVGVGVAVGFGVGVGVAVGSGVGVGVAVGSGVGVGVAVGSGVGVGVAVDSGVGVGVTSSEGEVVRTGVTSFPVGNVPCPDEFLSGSLSPPRIPSSFPVSEAFAAVDVPFIRSSSRTFGIMITRKTNNENMIPVPTPRI